MPITRLTRLELEGIYEADTVLRLLNGSQWVLPEKLPVPTGTTVNVHLEVVTPESEPAGMNRRRRCDRQSASDAERRLVIVSKICTWFGRQERRENDDPTMRRRQPLGYAFTLEGDQAFPAPYQ